MASEVGIINSALSKIGGTRISSRTEGTKNANIADEQFDKIRDKLLRKHPWNFAAERVQLAELSAAPAFEFDSAFQLPSDFIRVITVHDNDDGLGTIVYKIESDTRLLTSADSVYLRYVKRETDPNKMTPDFREALSVMLAEEFAVPIAQSNTLKEEIKKDRKEAVREAKSTDAIEDTPEQFPEGSWVTHRR